MGAPPRRESATACSSARLVTIEPPACQPRGGSHEVLGGRRSGAELQRLSCSDPRRLLVARLEPDQSEIARARRCARAGCRRRRRAARPPRATSRPPPAPPGSRGRSRECNGRRRARASCRRGRVSSASRAMRSACPSAPSLKAEHGMRHEIVLARLGAAEPLLGLAGATPVHQHPRAREAEIGVGGDDAPRAGRPASGRRSRARRG